MAAVYEAEMEAVAATLREIASWKPLAVPKTDGFEPEGACIALEGIIDTYEPMVKLTCETLNEERAQREGWKKFIDKLPIPDRADANQDLADKMKELKLGEMV